MRQLGFAYALQSVYDALVSIGLRDEATIEKLQGKKRDASSLFELAMFEGKTSRILYEHVPETAQKKLRIGLVQLVRSGLGHRDLPRVAGASECTSDEARDALERARAEWASVPEVHSALSRHAAA